MARKTRTETELDDILERVTRAEERLIHANGLVEDRHKEVNQKLESIQERLATMEKSLTKYQGFMGGVLMIASAVGTFLTLFWDVLLRKLGWTHE